MGEDSNKENWTYRKEKNFQSQLWPSRLLGNPVASKSLPFILHHSYFRSFHPLPTSNLTPPTSWKYKRAKNRSNGIPNSYHKFPPWSHLFLSLLNAKLSLCWLFLFHLTFSFWEFIKARLKPSSFLTISFSLCVFSMPWLNLLLISWWFLNLYL